jgi:hypothetical protein
VAAERLLTFEQIDDIANRRIVPRLTADGSCIICNGWNIKGLPALQIRVNGDVTTVSCRRIIWANFYRCFATPNIRMICERVNCVNPLHMRCKEIQFSTRTRAEIALAKQEAAKRLMTTDDSICAIAKAVGLHRKTIERMIR